MKEFWLVALVLILSLGFVACPPKDSGQEDSSMQKDFTLTSLDGEDITLSELKGNVVLVDFWATWCGPCRNSIPVFIRLYDKYHDRGFVVLGISQEDPQILDRYRKENNIPYLILMDDQNVAQEFGVRAIPSIFIYDKQGKVRETKVGFMPGVEAKFDELIDSLLKE